HLLDVLADEDIAAYLQPTSDVSPGMLATVLPSRPTDRLYVDRSRLEEAHLHVRRLGAETLRSDDLDARWAELVAQLEADDAHDEDDPEKGREPTQRTEGGDSGKRADTDAAPSDLRLPRIRAARPGHDPVLDADEPTLLDSLDADFNDDDDDEGFVPPPPPPLPAMSAPTTISLAVVAVGLLVLFWPASLVYLGINGTNAALIVATIALVGGGIGLVWQLRPAPDEDEDPSAGAQV
ncbi:MAG: hypothetical protein ACRDT1_00645, partial [Micromonosporaceae bacterium]